MPLLAFLHSPSPPSWLAWKGEGKSGRQKREGMPRPFFCFADPYNEVCNNFVFSFIPMWILQIHTITSTLFGWTKHIQH